jgi:hypothetical protein
LINGIFIFFSSFYYLVIIVSRCYAHTLKLHFLPSVCCLIPGTLTLAPWPKAAAGAVVAVLLSSLSLSSSLVSLSLLSVLADETAGELLLLLLLLLFGEADSKALPAAAATAKGDVLVLANEPKEGTEVVAADLNGELVSLVVDVVVTGAADLNPPKPELLAKLPNVDCYIYTEVFSISILPYHIHHKSFLPSKEWV